MRKRMYRIMQQQLEEQLRIVELTEKIYFYQQKYGLVNMKMRMLQKKLQKDLVLIMWIYFIYTSLQATGLPDTECLKKRIERAKQNTIGISNFEGKYMEELETEWEIVPQFIQVEAHPYFTQKELRVTLDKYGIKLMSWYPLGHGDTALMNELVFAGLGKKYGKTPAQVILRWHTQMGFVVIPGSKNAEHIKDNMDIFDFALTDEEMEQIAKLDKNERYYHRTDEQLVQFANWKPEFEK